MALKQNKSFTSVFIVLICSSLHEENNKQMPIIIKTIRFIIPLLSHASVHGFASPNQ